MYLPPGSQKDLHESIPMAMWFGFHNDPCLLVTEVTMVMKS
jgi:hypothetical protein